MASFFSTKFIHEFDRWLQLFRSLLSRSSKFIGSVAEKGPVFGKIGESFNALNSSPIFKTLSSIIGALGIILLAHFLFDCIIIIKRVFFNRIEDQEQNLSHGQLYLHRFKHALFKDGCIFRMANCLAWGAINLTTFILGITLGPAAILPIALLNLTGFGFDLGLAGTQCQYEIEQGKRQIKKAKGDETVSPPIDQLKKRLTSLKRNHTLNIVCASVVICGMALFYFVPPVAIVGVLLAILAGNILTGLGGAFFKLTKKGCHHIKLKLCKKEKRADNKMQIKSTNNKTYHFLNKSLEIQPSLQTKAITMAYTNKPEMNTDLIQSKSAPEGINYKLSI